MARAKKTWRPMKSRKNGLKSRNRINENNKVLKQFK